MTIAPKPYQKRAVRALSPSKILYGGTGAGKSLTALFYYVEKQRPKDIYIITTAKKRDSLEWERDAAKLGIQKERWDDYGALHVDSWNNIKKYVDVEGAFFILDEQRLVGTGAWVKSFLKIAKKNDWILLTATPGDKWEDYTAVFVANGFFKNQTQYFREHMVYTYYAGFPQLQRYLNEQKLLKLRDSVLVEMDYVAHTRRHIKFIDVEYDSKALKESVIRRQDPVTGEPFMNAAEMMYSLRRLVNSDETRKDALRDIHKKHKRLIVFYNFNYELDILREVFPGAAEWNGFVHNPLPDGESWVYLVQYTAGAEGWNCVTTDAMVFYSLTYSYKTFEQSQGRIDRVNTPYTDLKYYVLKSKSFVDRAVWEALETKRDFNEKEYLAEYDFPKNG